MYTGKKWTVILVGYLNKNVVHFFSHVQRGNKDSRVLRMTARATNHRVKSQVLSKHHEPKRPLPSAGAFAISSSSCHARHSQLLLSKAH